MSTLSTCGRCGGTIERRPGSAAGWGHVSETPRNADGHQPVPDDSAVSGPGRDDLPRCTGCHHPEHGEDGCEEEVSTGLYGTDGVLLLDWCSCTGPAACPATVTLPVNGQVLRCSQPGAHGDGDHLFDAAVIPDPWTDPDAAAALNPPPF